MKVERTGFDRTDLGMTALTLAFATYLIVLRGFGVAPAILTAVGAVAGIVLVVLLPRGVRELTRQVQVLSALAGAADPTSSPPPPAHLP